MWCAFHDGLSYFGFDSFSALPWLRHGVATRAGGVSAGPWATLNLGLRAGDAEAAVRENRRLLLAALGLEGAALSTGQQVHGDLAWIYRSPLPESQKIAGLACFYTEKVDLFVDGELQ